MAASSKRLLPSSPTPALTSQNSLGCFSFAISSFPESDDSSREGEPALFESRSDPGADEAQPMRPATEGAEDHARKQTRFGPQNGNGNRDEAELGGRPAHSRRGSRQEGHSGPLGGSRRHSRQPSRQDGFSGPLSNSRRQRSVLDEDPSTTRVVHINDANRNYLGKKDVSGNSVRTSKYTLLTFLPKNIFEQFQRVAYIYFLIIVILNQIPPLAVFGKTASVFPLAFVLVATALKDAYEDWGRHRSDREENNRTSLVYQDGSYEPKKLKHIRVGEMVKIHANEIVPADIVVLGTSDASGVAYVETMNLDGESNLKSRYAKQETARKHPEDGPVNGTLICELPNRNIYEFQAYLDMDSVHLPLGPNNILLRGCELKNTSWAIGVVVYAGRQTKAMLNNSGAQHKRSRLDRLLNRETGFLAVFLVTLCSVGAIGVGVWLHSRTDELNDLPFYRKTDQYNKSYYGVGGEAVIEFLSCMILFQVMVPIALYISLELVRLWQARFMIADTELYHVESNSKFQCRALTINEDLGQVKYVFSDKTGTLTENKMEFHSASVYGVDYDIAQETVDPPEILESSIGDDTARNSVEGMIFPADDRVVPGTNGGGPEKWKPLVGAKVDMRLMDALQSPANTAEYEAVHEYMLILAACNTIVPTIVQVGLNGQIEMNAAADDDGSGVIEYQGESPDEQALVSAAASYGYVLLERSFDSILIDVMGKRERYQVLGVHEFDSVRKRMSVLLRCPDGTIKLLVKGADNSMLEIIAKGGDNEKNQAQEKHRNGVTLSTMSHLDAYSAKGLRTLVVASKEIDASEYEKWRYHYDKASTALSGRVALLRETSELVEKDLLLVGATAIEDRLQEGVPETIFSLREAGMKVWVLTGDKQETAISIGFSCRLLTEEMQQIIIHESSKEGALQSLRTAKKIHKIPSDPVKYPRMENTEPSAEPFVNTNGSSSNFGSFSSGGDHQTSVGMNAKGSSELALIIDGTSLLYALDADVEQELYEVGRACKVVICCRVAPLQKAAVVNLIKTKTGDLTLAIGDGANDVSMIQMADVGIGLSGQEGRQAVMASDFAMGQFRFLKRLLLVHGHWNYQRLSYMILYNFYRNAVFVFVLFWFILYTAYSPTTPITDWSSVLYSVIYTSIPTIVIGTLDKNLSHRTLFKFPGLYGAGQRKEAYNQLRFWLTMMDTVWQSVVLFYVPFLSYTGGDVDLYGFGAILTFGVVLLVNLHLAMDVYRWNWIGHLAIWGSIVVTLATMLVLDSLPIDALLINYGSFKHILSDSRFYLDILIILPVALLPRFCLKVVTERFWPSDIQIAREFEIKGDNDHRNSVFMGPLELNEIPPP